MMRPFATGLLLFSMLALTGCGNDASKTDAKTGDQNSGSANTAPTGGGGNQIVGTIGVSVMTMTNPFFKIIADQIEEDAGKQGYKVIVTSGEDVATQSNQVKDFIVQKVDAIVLCPCDSRAIGPAIVEANKAGIPVFTADLACTAEDAKIVSHVASDNYGGGKQAGEAMIEALGDAGGKVLILDKKEAESCILRVNGFKEVIDAHNEGRETGKITVVAELPGAGDKKISFDATATAMKANPDITGIFAINDPSALGARGALETDGKQDQVKIIGFDGQIDGKQAIKDGRIYADPVQYPEKIASMTVDAIIKYFEGDEIEAVQLIPTGLYRQEDGMKDPLLKD